MQKRGFLSRDVLSKQVAMRLCQSLCSATAIVVMVAGILRLPGMELAETEVYFRSVEIMSFAGIFIVLALLFRLAAAQGCVERSSV